MPVKREPEQAPLEQCLCIAVPTELGPSRDLVSSSRASSDPCSPEGSQLHPRRGGSGKGRPRESCRRSGGRGAFLTQKKGEMAPWASSNPQTFPTTSFTHFRPPHAGRGGCLQTRVGSHLTPHSGFPNQTATGNLSEIQKGNCSYHCPTHTHVPSSPPHPLPPRKGSTGPLPQGSPYSNPIHMPRAVHSSCAAHGCSRAEKHSPGLVTGKTSPCWGCAGGAAPGPVSRARPASALDLWLLMRMCRNEWAVCNGQGDEEGVRGGGRAPRYASAASTPPAASLGHHRLDGEQAAELKVLDHRKLLQALQEGR